MAQLINEKLEKEIASMFRGLKEPVKIVFFTQEAACESCRQQEELLKSLTALSDKLTLEIYDLVKDVEECRRYKISRVPGTAIIGSKDYGIRFYGITAGYEFSSLIEAIFMVSRGASGLSRELEDLLILVDVPVHLEVMVTLTCPYCPQMVHLAQQMAVSNDNITADMVDAAEFPQLVQRYSVQGVPRTIINEIPGFEGALPPLDAIMEVLKVVKPHVYERIDTEMRKSRGEVFATQADPRETYQLIIVGAGPAAMSAAVYAARKDLNVALIGEHTGGQVTDTANIENWLGIPSISGKDLSQLFRDHVERYPVAEGLNLSVDSVAKSDGLFRVKTTDGNTFTAHSVIFCAGKQYRRLGIPGEDRFLGKGIAFCATCDAPLFRDKPVAVVGGGNSAFTAARDLIPFAREIHIINVLNDFQADPTLISEVSSARQVRFHPGMQVREFLGQDKLKGIRVESNDGKQRFDLQVDGVFLEIGLAPNTNAVKGFIELNEHGEIPVQRD
ncbi:MAG TPA: FAD-dependent oxidoreductase, partial [Deltaproteobacteria bacterium]|nr:FAD-dependent oxidoreductase [Deltaproteobacteria bacterium]